MTGISFMLCSERRGMPKPIFQEKEYAMFILHVYVGGHAWSNSVDLDKTAKYLDSPAWAISVD